MVQVKVKSTEECCYRAHNYRLYFYDIMAGTLSTIGRGGDPTRTKLRKKIPPNFGETTKKLTFYGHNNVFHVQHSIKTVSQSRLSNFHQKQTIFIIFGRLLGEFIYAILS